MYANISIDARVEQTLPEENLLPKIKTNIASVLSSVALVCVCRVSCDGMKHLAPKVRRLLYFLFLLLLFTKG